MWLPMPPRRARPSWSTKLPELLRVSSTEIRKGDNNKVPQLKLTDLLHKKGGCRGSVVGPPVPDSLSETDPSAPVAVGVVADRALTVGSTAPQMQGEIMMSKKESSW